MTLSDIAGRLLKGPGHPQPFVKDLPAESRPSLDRVSGFSFLTATESDTGHVAGCGGMVSNFGEPRGHSATATSWAKARPLSDIRELTEPSLADTIPRKLMSENIHRNTSRTELSRKQSSASRRRPSFDTRHTENREPERKTSLESNGIRSLRRGRSSRTPSPPSPTDNNSITSVYSIPPGSVPPRSSSHARSQCVSQGRQPAQLPAHPMPRFPPTISLKPAPALPPPPSKGSGNTIPCHGRSQSPVRQAANLDPITHDSSRRISSRTFIRKPPSKEIIEFPSHRHPRIELGLDLSAGVFVGGGSIEGTVQIKVDEADRIRHKRTLDIARISIDLLGIEELSGTRRCVFLNLATELIDEDNPPPPNMVDSRDPLGPEDLFWHLMPSITNLAFSLHLPLNVGPPPFQSKNARIRYVLCVSLLVRDQGKQYIVRTSESVTVLSVYDPEKALMSLPSPLTASDEWHKPRDSIVEILRVTAGLHRQVWVSGTSIYVDVHISNNTRKHIRKIELQLERDILCYKHAAASTMEKSAGQARIFDSNERSVLSRSTIKQGSAGWHGVPAFQTHLRTCDLEIPRGHATVKCGKYFEVRYFLNILVGTTHTKLVAVQLPIVLIHMNSLDVVPNSVAQVAMAIEEKRTIQRTSSLTRRPSQTVQGRAFAAPRMQSLERMRARAEDLRELGHTLDQSPRKYNLRHGNPHWDYRTPPSNRKGRILEPTEAADLQNRLRRARSTDTMTSRHRNTNNSANPMRGTSTRSKSRTGSALGFREAEVREDMELAGLGSGERPAPFKQRLEQSRERQARFSKKKSIERWRGIADVGVGWLKGGVGTNLGESGSAGGGGGKDERERDGWV